MELLPLRHDLDLEVSIGMHVIWTTGAGTQLAGRVIDRDDVTGRWLVDTGRDEGRIVRPRSPGMQDDEAQNVADALTILRGAGLVDEDGNSIDTY